MGCCYIVVCGCYDVLFGFFGGVLLYLWCGFVVFLLCLVL